MIFQILQNGLGLTQNIILTVVMLATVLFSLTFHEFAHGLVSNIQGDDTAKRCGRLSLNPFKHIDPLGFILMLVCGFGWAKAVPVNPRRYAKPKKGMAITALAGPLTNFLIGVSATVTLTVLAWLWASSLYTVVPILKYMSANVYDTVTTALYIVLYYNFLLAVFNMLPIPPFDGSRILFAILPTKYYFGVMRYEKLILVLVFLALWSGMLTGFFELIVDAIITGVSGAVLLVLELFARLFV